MDDDGTESGGDGSRARVAETIENKRSTGAGNGWHREPTNQEVYIWNRAFVRAERAGR